MVIVSDSVSGSFCAMACADSFEPAAAASASTDDRGSEGSASEVARSTSSSAAFSSAGSLTGSGSMSPVATGDDSSTRATSSCLVACRPMSRLIALGSYGEKW